MPNFIPLSVPNLKGNELKYITEAIEQEWVSTAGGFINRFETDIANYLNIKNAVACQSGTAGLHLALILSDINLGDEVIVPTLTFIAAVNPIKYLGAEPIFMDCDDTLTIDADKLEEFCEQECYYKDSILRNKVNNKAIKAVVVVHIFGNTANLEKIMKIANRFNLKVIEDATEALGTYFTSGIYKGKFAGSIGDFGVYSFNGNKIITTGGGGMLISNNDKLLEKAKYLSTQAKDDELYYTHSEIGYNYRMTNLQAALGVAQLEQLEKFISIKKNNYEYYKQKLKDIDGLEILSFKNEIRSNYWFYSLLINENYKYDKEYIIKFLAKHNIQVRPIWGLINEQQPYINSQSYKIEKAKTYINKIINIPCSSNLTEKEIDIVISLLKS